MRGNRRDARLRVLGLETSGSVCGVAHLDLATTPRNFISAMNEGKIVMREHISEFSRHSEAIYGLLDGIFRAARTRLEHVDVIAVSLGPGSFTGLRVGLAVAKVFSRFGGIPIVGVPTLEAQVAQAVLRAGGEFDRGGRSRDRSGRSRDRSGRSRYVATVDAKRGEVYAAVYACEGGCGLSRVKGPWVVDPEALGSSLNPGTIYVTVPPRADIIAALGAIRFLRGRRADPDRLVPVYVRRPAAVEKRLGIA